jgi:hypothetical protein
VGTGGPADVMVVAGAVPEQDCSPASNRSQIPSAISGKPGLRLRDVSLVMSGVPSEPAVN